MKDYKLSEMQSAIAKAESQMRSALAGPTIAYIVVSVICYFVINTVYMQLNKVAELDLSIVRFIMDFYPIIVTAPIGLAHYQESAVKPLA